MKNLYFQRITARDYSDSDNNQRMSRGQWDAARRLAAIEAMITFRPFAQKHTQTRSAWEKVFKAINNTSPDLPPLKNTAIRRYVIAARNQVRRQKSDSTYVSETHLENRTYYLDELMTQHEEQKNDEDDMAAISVFDLNQKRKQQDTQAEASSPELTPRKKTKTNNDTINLDSSADENHNDPFEIEDDDEDDDDNGFEEASSFTSRPNSARLDLDTLNKRRKALERDYSAALALAESEKYNQHKQFLDLLQVHHRQSLELLQNHYKTHTNDLKAYTFDIFEMQRKAFDQTRYEMKDMLQMLIDNQQHFFNNVIHIINSYIHPPPPPPPLRFNKDKYK